MQEKLIVSFSVGIIGVGIMYLFEGIQKLSEKISSEYSTYISMFIIVFIVVTIIQLIPDENK